LPEPPYYAVIFTSRRAPGGPGYGPMAERMLELAAQHPGFLGVDSVRDADGQGITVSYWKDLAAIADWRTHPEHLQAQSMGRAEWYESYEIRVARVERNDSFRKEPS